MRSYTRALAVGLALALTLAACNGGDDTEPEVDDNGEVEGEDEDEDGDEPDEEASTDGVTGPFRLGWILAYLSPEYALTDLYTCTGGSNNVGYCNEDYDQALRTANAAAPEDADALYQEAEDILLADLPIIPMWYGVSTSVWTERVDNIFIDAGTYLRVERIESEDDEFSAYGCEPETLIPQDSREVCGGRVVDQVFSGLLEINPDTNEPEEMVAESIEISDDQTVYTITIRDDFTFHDGTPVTVESFVDAWNFGADPENGFRSTDFFQQIDGFAAVQDGEAEELSGVEIVDDSTIQITLSEPFAPFLFKLSDSAFFPLPEVAYDDIDAFNEAPIGNGRYQMDGVWEREQQIALQRYEDWPGDEPGVSANITYAIYSDINTAYLDVQAGGLDVMEQIPPERLTDAENDFGDRVLQTETSSFTYLGFPMYQPEFGDSLELRQALSLAIDRQEIIDVIFDGAQTPATAIIPPVLDAYRDDACDVCEFDPERALDLFEQAGGYDGTMTIYYNSGAGHEEWAEAVSNQWIQVLGIENVEFESLDFAQYLELLQSGVE